MLHPLNPPNCTSQLNILITFQRQTLESANNQSKYSDTGFCGALDSNLAQWLLSRKTSGLKEDKVVREYFSDLAALIKRPQAEKQQALQDFDADQHYASRFDVPSHQFIFRNDKSPTHQLAAKCLIAFYEFLGIAGYPAGVAGAKALSKADLVQGYKATNPWIEYICPCCDSQFVDTPGANPEGYTLEHYFPKAIYAAVCLHPLNLIPMCVKCNKRKDVLDPLLPDATQPSSRVPFDEVFHPIERPVRKNADLGFFPSPTGREDMRFVSLSNRPLLEAIASYGILYEIPERWRILWKRVDYRIDTNLKRALRAVTLTGRSLDERALMDAIDMAIDELERQLGYEHFSYPAMQWLRWARSNHLQELYQAYCVP